MAVSRVKGHLAALLSIIIDLQQTANITAILTTKQTYLPQITELVNFKNNGIISYQKNLVVFIIKVFIS